MYRYLPFVLFFACTSTTATSEQALALGTIPIVGAVTQTGAIVAVRASGSVQVEYSTAPTFSGSTVTASITTDAGDDYTAHVPLTGLTPSTRYWYRVLVGGQVTDTGVAHRFDTFGANTCTIAIVADVANADRAAPAYLSARDAQPDIVVQLGDMDHSNPASLDAARAMHRAMKSAGLAHGRDFARLASKAPVMRVWDDHDYCGNDTDRTCASKTDALQAMREHWPSYPRPGEGLWHAATCGPVHLIALDLRSQRDPGAGAMLGTAQRAWLETELEASIAPWIVVLSSVTGNRGARPNSIDLWHAYAHEAQDLAELLGAHENLVIVSADLHTGGGVDDGANSLFARPELGTPHTNLAQGNAANFGTWSHGVTCGRSTCGGGPGYGVVRATQGALALEAYDENGTLRHALTR